MIQGYVTDPQDRESLEFFLTADQDELKAWNAIATEHDIMYAQALMQAYAKELELVAAEQRIDLQLESMQHQYMDAALVIDRIRYC